MESALNLPLVSLLSVLLYQSPAPAPAQAEPAAKEKQAASTRRVVHLAKPSGVYADFPDATLDLSSLLLGAGLGKTKSFYQLLERFDSVAKDPEAKDVVLDLSGNMGLNLVQVGELDRCLRRLRGAGKKLHAYLEQAGTIQMQLAALCDHVVMADMGIVEIPSPSLSVTFMKDALDLLGVEMDVVRCGDFKGAVEPYVLSSMSKHLRAHYSLMLEKINSELVLRLARGRNLSTETVRRLQAQRILTARQALEVGLVDELVPWVGAKQAIAKTLKSEKNEKNEDLLFKDVLKSKKKAKSLNVFTLVSSFLNTKKETTIKDGLVVLHLSGTIADGSKARPGSIVSGPTVKVIRKLIENEKARGVVVRINSPGGSATASEAILLALADLARTKPVAISMGRLAASGGYYVTCIGKTIFAEPGTITGSIGVFALRPSLGALMRRVGIHEEIVALDEGAAFGSLSEPWTGEQKALVQNFVNEIYDRFVSHVSASRGLPMAEVLKLAGGRVWSGEQALANKLVDRIGGLKDALDVVAKEAGLEKGYAVSHMPKPPDAFAALAQELLGARTRALLGDSTLKGLLKGGGLERALAILWEAMTRQESLQIWAMMPETLRLR